MDDKTKLSADRAFKKEQKAVEALEAWKAHDAGQAHINANMERLRNERLAREAAPTMITPVLKKRAKKKAA